MKDEGRLKELKRLDEEGNITEEEFQEMRDLIYCDEDHAIGCLCRNNENALPSIDCECERLYLRERESRMMDKGFHSGRKNV